MSGKNPPTGSGVPAPKKQPSLYARKLLQKLSTLHPDASLECRQTIASWMVFNRRRCEGMCEGLISAVESSSSAAEGDGASSSSARLMLLLRIVHQVVLSNCPTAAAAAAGAEGNADKWEKSSELRARLGEVVVISLFKALAASTGGWTGRRVTGVAARSRR